MLAYVEMQYDIVAIHEVGYRFSLKGSKLEVVTFSKILQVLV